MAREKPMCNRIVRYIRKGPIGRLPVPCGIYDASATYTCTSSIAPYVLFDGEYYIMNKEVSFRGATEGRNPKQDYAQFGSEATWQYMERYKAIFVEMMMADFGKIASAIFYGPLMFSQQGTVNGAASSDYSKLKTNTNGDVNEAAGNFIPNFWVNFLNGKLSALDAVIKGIVNATSGSFENGEFTKANIKTGKIGGFDITENWLNGAGENYGVRISPATINLFANAFRIEGGNVTTNFEAHPYPAVYSWFYILFRLTSAFNVSGDDYATGLYSNILMYLSASGAKRPSYRTNGEPYGGNFVVWCPSGQFAGLRPHTRHISASTALTNTDHTIIVNNSAEITLTLPADPELGQTFEIWHATETKLNVQSYNRTTRKYIYRLTESSGFDYTISSGKREIIKLVYAHNTYRNSAAEDGIWMMIYYGKTS